MKLRLMILKSMGFSWACIAHQLNTTPQAAKEAWHKAKDAA